MTGEEFPTESAPTESAATQQGDAGALAWSAWQDTDEQPAPEQPARRPIRSLEIAAVVALVASGFVATGIAVLPRYLGKHHSGNHVSVPSATVRPAPPVTITEPPSPPVTVTSPPTPSMTTTPPTQTSSAPTPTPSVPQSPIPTGSSFADERYLQLLTSYNFTVTDDNAQSLISLGHKVCAVLSTPPYPSELSVVETVQASNPAWGFEKSNSFVSSAVTAYCADRAGQ